MSATAAVVAVCFAAFGIGLVVLAVRLSGATTELGMATSEADRLRISLDEALKANASLARKLETAAEDQAERLRYLREQLDECGDDATRGRVAAFGIRRLLQSLEEEAAADN